MYAIVSVIMCVCFAIMWFLCDGQGSTITPTFSSTSDSTWGRQGWACEA